MKEWLKKHVALAEVGAEQDTNPIANAARRARLIAMRQVLSMMEDIETGSGPDGDGESDG